MINTSLGNFIWKNRASLKMGQQKGTSPSPASSWGLSLRSTPCRGSSYLCQIHFPVPGTTLCTSLESRDTLHQFRPTSCGSFPAAFKPPWATRLSLSFVSQPPFLEELFIFTVALPCLPFTLSLSVVWLPTATPGTSLIKVIMASMTLT